MSTSTLEFTSASRFSAPLPPKPYPGLPQQSKRLSLANHAIELTRPAREQAKQPIWFSEMIPVEPGCTTPLSPIGPPARLGQTRSERSESR